MIPDAMRQKILEEVNQPPDPPMTIVQEFVARYCSNGPSVEEVRTQVRRELDQGQFLQLLRSLRGLDGLLASPPEGWALVWLVEVDANRPVGGSNEAAVAYLSGLAGMIREEIEQRRDELLRQAETWQRAAKNTPDEVLQTWYRGRAQLVMDTLKPRAG